jgi:hypothetical protein
VATEQGAHAQVELYTSALPVETSADLADRWELEVTRRLDRTGALDGSKRNLVVIGLGTADIDQGVSLARSRLNLAKVLDGLEQIHVPVFVVGPPPSRDRGRTMAVRELSGAFEDVCARRRVPFVDTVVALDGHDQWVRDQGADDLPGQTGYGLLAWLVLHGGFGTFLGTAV